MCNYTTIYNMCNYATIYNMCYSIYLNQRINFLHFVCIETKRNETNENRNK